jgi:hypothetical protein
MVVTSFKDNSFPGQFLAGHPLGGQAHDAQRHVPTRSESRSNYQYTAVARSGLPNPLQICRIW